MRLVIAQGALLEHILDVTYPVWHEGLTRQAYGQWNGAQMRTPWGREHLHRVALVDDSGRLLASAKRYRFPIRLDNNDGWMCGLGAVFTPVEQRGRGYAGALIKRLLDEERSRGVMLAALFSEIGPAFYRRLGFDPVPFDEVTVRVDLPAGAPAMLVRAGDERDLPDVGAIHNSQSGPARFALRRDPSLIQYAVSKKRLFAGLSSPGTRQLEFFVAEEGASAAAYVVLGVAAGGWTLEDAGDRDPAAARVGALLQVLTAREPSHRPPRIRAWWPPAFPVPPQVRLTDRTPARDLFMLRSLMPVALPSSATEVFYWHIDYF
jgi:predicted N-acetyltransferase YhbS